ncbi:MAG: class I SAM-dependent methyltransferase [Acidobacteria bacterium]|nr:class I SAM-dependent methyltransferase [Acidobacteriota bacterium]
MAPFYRSSKAILVMVILGMALEPSHLLHGFKARPPNVQESRQGKRRVYTNDDFPPAVAPPAANGDAASQSGAVASGERVAPFVPTPMQIVDKMLEIASVSSGDVVYDLGSGDGRIVLRAAERFGARAVGVELDHGLAVESAEKAKEMKLDKLVTIIEGDLFQTDFKPATVVTIYLLLSTNDRLRPLLEKDLRPGTRVVAHDIRIPGWEPAREESFDVGTVPHTVYLYQIPGAFKKPPAP